MKKKSNTIVQEYLSKLDKNDLLSIIKYGLRGSNAPVEVDVEDIFDYIGCLYVGEYMNELYGKTN